MKSVLVDGKQVGLLKEVEDDKALLKLANQLYSLEFMNREDIDENTKDFYRHIIGRPKDAAWVMGEIKHALETRLKGNNDEAKHIYDLAEIIRINHLGYTFDDLPEEIFKEFLLNVISELDLYEIAKEIYYRYKDIISKEAA